MRNIIFKKETKNVLREKGFLILFYSFLPVVIFIGTSYSIAKGDNHDFMGKILLNFSVSSFSLSWFFLFAVTLFPDVFYKEKMQKTLETLLCSPASISDIFLGKSLMISLIAFSIVVMNFLINIFAVNFFFSSFHNFILPSLPALLIGIFVVPILGFSIVLFMGMVTFCTDKYKIVSFILPLIVMGFFYFSSSKMQSLQPNWAAFFLSVLAALLIFLCALRQLRYITKEDIIIMKAR